MSPIYGHPEYDFDRYESYPFEEENEENNDQTNLTQMAFWYMMVLVAMLLLWLLLFFCLRIIALRQKTRSPQQRRMYMGARARPSLGQNEPTIYVSPSNLPPPPKYECMAPPSYEEVVGVHYPNYQVQPITQPIAAAMAQSTSNETSRNEGTSRSADAPEAVVTVATEDRRTSITVARS